MFQLKIVYNSFVVKMLLNNDCLIEWNAVFQLRLASFN